MTNPEKCVPSELVAKATDELEKAVAEELKEDKQEKSVAALLDLQKE